MRKHFGLLVQTICEYIWKWRGELTFLPKVVEKQVGAFKILILQEIIKLFIILKGSSVVLRGKCEVCLPQ